MVLGLIRAKLIVQVTPNHLELNFKFDTVNGELTCDSLIDHALYTVCLDNKIRFLVEAATVSCDDLERMAEDKGLVINGVLFKAKIQRLCDEAVRLMEKGSSFFIIVSSQYDLDSTVLV